MTKFFIFFQIFLFTYNIRTKIKIYFKKYFTHTILFPK